MQNALLAGYLVVLGVLAVWIQLKGSSDGDSGRGNAQYRAFRDNYILVFSIAMAGDWLQGPYIYCLYEHYGYSVGNIGRFFIAGFASSMLFGTLAGVLADKYGRRMACLGYVVSYIGSCLTKHSAAAHILFLGRVLGGISTSLLFSSFESWLVAEHSKRGMPEGLLSEIFSRASYVGAGLMAIVSGLVGNFLVEDLGLGPVAPFDAAVVALAVAGGIMLATWPENYGGSHTNTKNKESLLSCFMAAVRAIMTDERIALLGIMQALFEASMYTFVFLWTPALSPAGEKVPHGLVFSCFMTACMAGSAATTLLLRKWKPQHYMAALYACALLSMGVPYLCNLNTQPQLKTESKAPPPGGKPVSPPQMGLQGQLQILAFCVFEACLGIFWPSMMTLRAQLLPEGMRSSIINIFRIPLNLFVCLALYKVSEYPLSVMFFGCMVALGICTLCQWRLNRLLGMTHAEDVNGIDTFQVKDQDVASAAALGIANTDAKVTSSPGVNQPALLKRHGHGP